MNSNAGTKKGLRKDLSGALALKQLMGIIFPNDKKLKK